MGNFHKPSVIMLSYLKGEISMDYGQIIANRILSLCRQRRLSINKLANMSNIKQSTVDNIIHGGSRNPQIKTLHKVAYAFGMTMSEFFDFQEMDDVSFEDDGNDEQEEI